MKKRTFSVNRSRLATLMAGIFGLVSRGSAMTPHQAFLALAEQDHFTCLPAWLRPHLQKLCDRATTQPELERYLRVALGADYSDSKLRSIRKWWASMRIWSAYKSIAATAAPFVVDLI